MKMNNPSWRHHYIPEFYLKRWANGKGQLVEFSKPYGDLVKPKRVYPRQTGFMDKIYQIENVPSNLEHFYEETYFKPVDTRAADALANLESGKLEIPIKERTAWTTFLITMLYRFPENIESLRVKLVETIAEIDEFDENEYVRKRQTHEPATLQEAINLESREAFLQKVAMQILTSKKASQKLGTKIINLRWITVRFDYDLPALLSSDRPVLTQYNTSHEDFHLFMPIGPKLIFAGYTSDYIGRMLDTVEPANLVNYINTAVTRQAKKYVYAFSDSQQSFIQENMGKTDRNPLSQLPIHIH